jgi:hypothetical protein
MWDMCLCRKAFGDRLPLAPGGMVRAGSAKTTARVCFGARPGVELANRNPARRHNVRDPLTQQFVRAPATTDKSAAPLLEREFTRYVAAIRQRLGYEFGKRHGVQVSRIPFSTRLALKALAICVAKIEVLQERYTNGMPVDDDLLHRLLCEQSRRLRQLGMAEAVIKPSAPAKPMRSLSSIIKAQAAAR